MDLGISTKHKAVVMDGTERRGKPFAVEVSRDGFEELLTRAGEGSDGPATIVMEPTGLAWVPVAAYLSAAGHQVHLAKPQKVSHLRKFLKQHTKSDVIDAEANARLPQVDPDGVHKLELPTPDQMALRRLVKRRERMAQEGADQKRRVHALMVMVNPPLMAALGDSAFSRPARSFYRKYADPEPVAKMGREKLRQFWDKHNRGPVDEKLIDRIVTSCAITTDLYAELRRNQKLPFEYADIQDELRAELDWMEQAEQQVERLNESIKSVYDRCDPDHTLEQIRGIGTIIAAAIEALVANVLRFHNGRQFVSYSGLCPRKRQSGQSDPPLPITKCGQRLLKKYFYLAADVARHWDAEFAAYYARRYARGDHHNLIMIALARKMALRVYALLKRRDLARHAGSPQSKASFVLRDPATGNTVDKTQARALVVENYTRAAANPERNKRERARRSVKAQGTGLAKEEWPSKDATSQHAVPDSQITHTPDGGNNSAFVRAVEHGTTRGGGWFSIADILSQWAKVVSVEKPVDSQRKNCEQTSLPSLKFAKKRS